MTLVKPVIALLLAIGIAGTMGSPGAQATANTSGAAADPARGAQLFLQCRACHTVAPGAASTVGPNLSGVVGAKAGMRPGYSYSPALMKSGITWNTASLDTFLKRPTQAVPGTKMAFAGVADAKARADLIAYLTTLKGRK